MGWKSPISNGQAVDIGAAAGTGGLALYPAAADALTGSRIGTGIANAPDTLRKALQNAGKAPNLPQVSGPNPDALQQIDPNQFYKALAGQNAPQLNTADSDQFRAQQLQLANRLSNQAQGIGPSVTGTQLQQGQAATLAATMAQLNSSRGGANPLAARQALQSSQDVQNKMTEDAAVNRLQEQMAAAGMLNNVAGGARAQDITTASQNANLQQNFEDLQQKYMGMGMSAQEANQRAALDYSNQQNQANQFNAGQATAAQGLKRQTEGQFINAGGGLAAAGIGGLGSPSSAASSGGGVPSSASNVNNVNSPTYDPYAPTVEGPALPPR